MLLIFAHPDDESFILGGTIAKAAGEGAEIHLVCATKGEAGKTAGLCAQEELGACREKELRTACHILGIKELTFLGYHDKEVPDAPAEKILEQLVRKIRAFRPQVILTFGPDGASGHQDHKAIHRWAKAAVQLAGRPAEPEWGEPYAVPRFCYVVAVWRLNNKEGFTPDYRIDISAWGKIKWQAIEQHRTQVRSIQNFAAMDPKTKAIYLGQEFFNADKELSRNPGGGTDLFEGLNIDG